MSDPKPTLSGSVGGTTLPRVSKDVLVPYKSTLKKAVNNLTNKSAAIKILIPNTVETPALKEDILKKEIEISSRCEKGIVQLNAYIQMVEKARDSLTAQTLVFMESNQSDTVQQKDFETRCEEATDAIIAASEVIADAQGYATEAKAQMKAKLQQIENEKIWGEEREARREQRQVAMDAAANTVANLVRNAAEIPTPGEGGAPVVPSQARGMPSQPVPKLKLPSFKGEAWSWPNFIDIFDELIESRKDLSDTHKLNYLVGCLEGEPLQLVNTYVISKENYRKIYDELKNKYGDEKQNIVALMKKLESTKSEGTQPRFQKLLYREIAAILNQLRARKHEEVDKSVIWWNRILAKFNGKIQHQVNQKISAANHKKKVLSIEKFMDYLSIALDADELDFNGRPNEVASNSKGQNKGYYKRTFNNQNHQGPQSFETQVKEPSPEKGKQQGQSQSKGGQKSQQQQQTGRVNSCVFCGKSNHIGAKCKTFANVEDRIKRLNENGRCIKCCSKEHQSKDCNTKVECFTCGGKHYSFVCKAKSTKPNTVGKPADKKTSTNVAQAPTEKSQTTNNHVVQNNKRFEGQIKRGHLWLMKVNYSSPNARRSREFYALLDTGSENSYITRELAHELELESLGEDEFHMYTCANNKPNPMREEVVKLQLKPDPKMDQVAVDSGKRRKSKKKDNEGKPEKVDIILHTLESLTQSTELPQMSDSDWKYIRQKGLKMAFDKDVKVAKPEVLIGVNYLWACLWNDGEKQRLPSGKLLMLTLAGFICVDDPAPRLENKLTHAYVMQVRKPEEFGDGEFELPKGKLVEEITDPAGQVEYVGPLKEELRRIDEKVQQFFESTVEKVESNGKVAYQVRLPYRIDEQTSFPNNRSIAVKRLESVYRQIHNDASALKKYDETFKMQLEKGILEPVDENAPPDGPRVCYLPHQPVFTPKKTTDLRVVFDASACYRNKMSLNDALHQGPTLLPSLAGTLLRFRFQDIALISDIEKAFLQVKLALQDRDACRVFWLKDANKPPTRDNIMVLRFCSVLFGLICSPYLLAATIRYHLDSYDMESKLKDELLRNLYVDNAYVAASTTVEAVEKYEVLKRAFEEAGMNLREFLSNDKDTMSRIPEKDKCTNMSAKFMGIKWSADKDVLTVPSIEMPTEDKNLSKRKVLRFLNSQYDPLGWRIPLLVSLKTFYRKINEANYDWDQTMRLELIQEFREICEKVAGQGCEIQRIICRSSEMSTPKQLVCFADASGQGIGACVYLRDPTSGKSTLLMAKAALVDAKMTIPKREMCAVLLGLETTKFIFDEISSVLQVVEILVFTDNSCCVELLKRPKSAQGTFMRNRLRKIAEIAEDLEKRQVVVLGSFVGTSDNIADITTRSFSDLQFWWTGPLFLESVKEDFKERMFSLTESEGEEYSVTLNNLCRVERVKKPNNSDQEHHELSRSNSFFKTQKIFCYMLRFIRKLAKGLNPKRQVALKRNLPSVAFEPKDKTKALTVYETIVARRELTRLHQKQFLDAEFCRKNQKLDMFLDKQGIYRCGGRFMFSSLNPNAKNPIVVAPKTRLARLITTEIHEHYHKGREHTIQDIRLLYWIPAIRSEVNPVIRKCVNCQRFNNLPFKYPDMAQLPGARVNASRPFQFVGLDYLGPLNIKVESKTESPKVYVLLLTCATTRLIHLETVSDLTTTAFLNAVRRFFSRRGVPETISSDNAPTFLLGEKIAKEAIENWKRERDTKFHELLLEYKVEWIHTVAYAPWMGGWWERLVGSTKKAYQKTFGRKKLGRDECNTSISEIEAVLNSRPLTYRSSESLTLLRPADFLQSNAELTFPWENLEDKGDEYLPSKEMVAIQTRKQATEALKASVEMVERFWMIWRDFYLTDLRDHHKKRMSNKVGSTSEPRVGQVVLLVDPDLKRNEWSLGRIIKLLAGTDAVVRGARVKTGTGQISERPINLLVPLELEDDSIIEESDQKKLKAAKEKNPKVEDSRYQLRERKLVSYREEVEKDDSASLVSNLVQSRYLPKGTLSERKQTSHVPSIQNNLCQTLINLVLISGIPTTSADQMEEEPEFCGQIRCYFCADSIFNPDCHPFISIPLIIIFLVVALVAGSAITALIIKSIIRLYRGAHGIRNRINTRRENLRRRRRQTNAQSGPPLLVQLLDPDIELELWSRTETAQEQRQDERPAEGSQEPLQNVEAERKPEREIKTRMITGHQKEKLVQRVSTLVAIAATILLLGTVEADRAACQKVFVSTGKLLRCNDTEYHPNSTTCVYETLLKFDFDSVKTTGCVVLLNKKNQVGKIVVTWSHVEAVCEEVDDFFTRDVNVTFQSDKRCPSTGSCEWKFCHQVRPDTKVDELAEANAYVGSTYCVESISGWTQKCFYGWAACIFYRTFAKPLTEDIFRKSYCRSWENDVRLRITVSGIDKINDTDVNITMIPGLPKKVESIEVSVANLYHPHYTEMWSHYLTNVTSPKNETYVLPDVFDPVAACSSIDEAKTFNSCAYRETCTCRAAEIEANCYCPSWSFQKDLTKNQRFSLPAKRPGLELFRRESGKLVARLRQDITFSINMQLEVETEGIAEMVQDDICRLSQKKVAIKGCYRCSQGATMEVVCLSNAWSVKAQVTCNNDVHFELNCSPGGSPQVVAIQLNSAYPKMSCQIDCGQLNTEFEASGILRYDPWSGYELRTKERKGSTSQVEEGWNWTMKLPDLSSLAWSLFYHPMIVLVVLVSMGLIATVVILKYFPKIIRILKFVYCLSLIISCSSSLPGVETREITGSWYEVEEISTYLQVGKMNREDKSDSEEHSEKEKRIGKFPEPERKIEIKTTPPRKRRRVPNFIKELAKSRKGGKKLRKVEGDEIAKNLKSEQVQEPEMSNVDQSTPVARNTPVAKAVHVADYGKAYTLGEIDQLIQKTRGELDTAKKIDRWVPNKIVGKSPKRLCKLCKDPDSTHFEDQCLNVILSQDRRRNLREAGLCLVCLDPESGVNHPQNCRVRQKPCFYCSSPVAAQEMKEWVREQSVERHHSAICALPEKAMSLERDLVGLRYARRAIVSRNTQVVRKDGRVERSRTMVESERQRDRNVESQHPRSEGAPMDQSRRRQWDYHHSSAPAPGPPTQYQSPYYGYANQPYWNTNPYYPGYYYYYNGN